MAGKLLALWLYLNDRMKEPSTHAAISSLLITAGVSIDSGVFHDLIVLISLGFGGLGIFTAEAKRLGRDS